MGADPLVGTDVGGYRVEELLGRGGMGSVYLAEHLHLQRKVALKILGGELASDESFRQRFIRESRLAAALEHPNIIPVFDAGEAGGLLYLAMRFVRGTDLRSVIDERGTLDPDRTLGILERVAAALDEAHANGLVHRDVKPANVMLESRPGRTPAEHVFLTDFGIARRLDAGGRITRTGMFVGTLDYAAPEVLRAEEAGPAVDVYALGCVLYECLTGSVPFPREALATAMVAHLFEPPPSARERRPELPARIDAVISRAMAKDAADRFESCAELISAARTTFEAGDEPEPAVGAPPQVHMPFAGAVPAAPSAPPTPAVDPPPRVSAETTAPADGPPAPAPPATMPATTDQSEETRVSASAPAEAAASAPTAPVEAASSAPPAPPRARTQFAEPPPLAVRRPPSAPAGRPREAGPPPPPKEPTASRRRPWWIAAAVVAILVVVPLVALLATGGSPEPGRSPSVVARPSAPSPETPTTAPTQTSGPTSSPDASAPPPTPPGFAVTKTLRVGVGPTGVTVGEGFVWTANRFSGSVSRIDPDTNEVRTFDVGGGPADVAITSGTVWVSDNSGGTVLRMDPETGKVLTRIPVGTDPGDLAVLDGKVWVVTFLDQTVRRIDPATNRVGQTLTFDLHPSTLTAGLGSLWVGFKLELRRVDPATGATIASIPVGQGDGAPEAAVTADAVWASHDISGRVVRIDPATNGVVARLRIPEARTPAIGAGSVFVPSAGADGTSSTGDDRLVRIDPAENRIVERIVARGSGSAAVDGGVVWLSDFSGRVIQRIER